ncbi:MAG: Hsp70 family protein [Planctomycetaceae bacterium]|jgi:molecular chaperone DnaK (HSP70)|nr:Hsp70 family protein [Planctomycetaceae bacterium]
MSENSQKRIYGIDLGTTYSAIAFINEHGKAEIITNSDNERVTPSVVFFETEDNVIVGKIAKEAAKADPEKVADFVKRNMSDPNWSFTVHGQEYKPEEISAHILRRLANDAKKTGEHDVQDVVITCPAYFGDLERERTRIAGQLAGLNVIEILDEPVAAAINYGLNEDAKGKNVIVYDLGGGTFDVTVVKIGNDPNKNEIEIICTEGNHQLGGKDWDDEVVKFLVSEFHERSLCSANVLEDQEFAYDIRFSAENDKKTLTNRDKVSRKVSFEGEKAVVELTRDKFDELTAHLFEQTEALTDKVLEEAKARGIDKIHAFLLVGGSTRMPQIKAKITEKYAERLGITPVEFDVDEAVAKGAAKAGEIKLLTDMANDGTTDFDDKTEEEKKETIKEIAEETGKTEEEVLLAVTTKLKKVATKSYGIRALKSGEPIVRNLIVKQTPVPTAGSQVFGTAGPNADEIDLVVYVNNESETDAPIEMCEQLGDAVFILDGNLPAKAPIEITFELNDQGSLTLVGLDKTHGKKITANFKTDGIMTENEIKEAQKKQRDLVIN